MGRSRAGAGFAAVVLAVLVSLGGSPPRTARADEPVSLVDWLKGHGRDASFEARRAIFRRLFPGEPYTGSAEENVKLLEALRREEGGMADGSADTGSPPMIVRRRSGNVEYEVDLARQVLELELREDRRTEWRDWGAPPQPDRVEEPPVEPRLDVASATRFVSASVLAQKAKVFDDGLYAAVEMLAEDALGTHPGKRALLLRLRTLLDQAGATGAGAAVSVAAADLGGVDGPTPAGLRAEVENRRREFDADPLLSKPLGFYTWSDALRRVFRQDRMLQTELCAPDVEEVVQALARDPEAAASYTAMLELYERLTNPYASVDLRSLLGGEATPRGEAVRILPASRAYETDLVKRFWGDRPVPEGASAIDLLVREVTSGRLSLRPNEGSGWYDRQTWALEPLIRPDETPEAKKLRLGPRYRAYLVELFKGLLALTRETHVKQLEIPPAGAAAPPREPLFVRPELSVEPLATHYRRRAASYAYVRGVLVGAFGEARLTGAHRLTAEGPVAEPLLAELDRMQKLFRGAAQTAFQEVGSSEASPTPEAAADRQAFSTWAQALASDPDLGRDARMMVPVFYDVPRHETKVWVFLGWTEQALEVQFVARPVVTIPGASGDRPIEFYGTTYSVCSPVVAEVYVTELLDRTQMRALCDQYKTRSAILAHLR